MSAIGQKTQQHRLFSTTSALVTTFFLVFLSLNLPCFLLPLSSHDGLIGLNLTNTFLVFTEEDIGDLLKISLSWEGEADSWNSVWKNIKKSFWSWNAKPPKPVLEVRRIRVKAGETQKK